MVLHIPCKHGLVVYDGIRCKPSDVYGYLIRTSGCLIWHDLTSLVFTIYGCGGHLGHMTRIMSSDDFLVPESFHTKFGSDQHSSF